MPSFPASARALSPGFLLALFLISFLPASAAVVSFKKVGTNLVISVPASAPQQLLLEGKSGDGWKPLVAQCAGSGIQNWASRTSKGGQATVTFPVPAGYALNQLRVVTSSAKFPVARLGGPKSFPGNRAVNSRVLPYGAGGSLAVTAMQRNAGEKDSPVVESDIWKLAGNQLFFFNQYRGLQVFDLSDATHPVRTGGLRLPASGEQKMGK